MEKHQHSETAEKKEELEEKEVEKELLGLNTPVHERYLKWLSNILSGDLGTYYTDKKPVSYLLFMYMADSFLLNAVAFIVAISIALPMGVLAALPLLAAQLPAVHRHGEDSGGRLRSTPVNPPQPQMRRKGFLCVD